MISTDPEVTRSEGRLSVFGHEPGTAHVDLLPRTTRWRLWRAARPAAIGLLLAPVVVLVPPHAPWALGALVTGAVLAMRRWREEVTLLSLQGRCPRCDTHLTLVRPRALRPRLSLDCEGCRHEVTLSLPAEGPQGS